MSHAGPARRWSGLAVLAGLAGVFWSQVRWARVSNFGGYDEWLILWLTSRGIVSFPYARRPLELVCALLLWMAAAGKPRRLWVWMALWEGMVGLAAARILWQFLGTGSYQGAMGLDWRPLAVGARLLHQYALHLRPLAMLPEGTLAPALVSAITAAAAVALATVRRGEILAGPDARPRCVALMALGLALAGCGYAFFVLSAGVREAERTEFLSAPGIGLFLAASAGLVATA